MLGARLGFFPRILGHHPVALEATHVQGVLSPDLQSVGKGSWLTQLVAENVSKTLWNGTLTYNNILYLFRNHFQHSNVGQMICWLKLSPKASKKSWWSFTIIVSSPGLISAVPVRRWPWDLRPATPKSIRAEHSTAPVARNFCTVLKIQVRKPRENVLFCFPPKWHWLYVALHDSRNCWFFGQLKVSNLTCPQTSAASEALTTGLLLGPRHFAKLPEEPELEAWDDTSRQQTHVSCIIQTLFHTVSYTVSICCFIWHVWLLHLLADACPLWPL